MGIFLSLAVCVTLGLVITAGCNSNSDPSQVGSDAPDFSVVRPNDEAKKVSFKDLKGKVVLLDFWATWCGPCKAEMPSIEKLWERNQSKGVEVMAISDEKAPDILNFESAEGYKLPFYEDSTGEANKVFSIKGYPTTVVIGKDGKIVYYGVGAGVTVEEELQKAIDQAIQ